MTDTRNATLKGMWAPGKTLHRTAHQIAPRPDGYPRLGSVIDGDKASLTATHSLPGQHSTFFIRHGASIVFDEREFPLRLWAKRHRIRTKVDVLGAGETITFDGRTLSRTIEALSVPEIDHDLSTDQHATKWYETLVAATREIYEWHGKGQVAVAASGGTDSALIIRALKDIGADVIAMSAGVQEDDFDPRWARIMCDHWGVPFHFVRVDLEPSYLEGLLRDTLRLIEQTSFSNVLMGLCCTEMQRFIEAQGVTMTYTGYHADILMGNKIHVVGEFRALPESDRTDQTWRDIRAKYAVGMIPNTHQLHKNFAINGAGWRAPFGHPDVIRQSLTLPLEVSPAEVGHKWFLERVLNRMLPAGKRPWEERNKVGFYSGAGLIADRRGEILSEQNMRAVMRTVKAGLGL